MSNKVKAIPEGYHSVTPYLIVDDAIKALEFYKKAFNAIEIIRLLGPNNKVAHAEIKIGDSPIMLADECPEMNAISPKSLGGSPISIMLYVEDVDALAKQATQAGANVVRPVEDQFYGDRTGVFKDPFGHQWSLATHKEDVSKEELDKRLQELMKK